MLKGGHDSDVIKLKSFKAKSEIIEVSRSDLLATIREELASKSSRREINQFDKEFLHVVQSPVRKASKFKRERSLGVSIDRVRSAIHGEIGHTHVVVADLPIKDIKEFCKFSQSSGDAGYRKDFSANREYFILLSAQIKELRSTEGPGYLWIFSNQDWKALPYQLQ